MIRAAFPGIDLLQLIVQANKHAIPNQFMVHLSVKLSYAVMLSCAGGWLGLVGTRILF